MAWHKTVWSFNLEALENTEMVPELFPKTTDKESRPAPVSPGGSTMQGAAPVTEHSDPDSWMSVTQQSAPVRPGTFPHVGPPQTPQAASQQVSWLSIPARPLLQVEFAAATAVEERAGDKHDYREQAWCDRGAHPRSKCST